MTAGKRRAISVGASIIAIGAFTTMLQGCFPLVAAGIGGTALVADDRRTTGIIVEDEGIENKTLLRIEQKHGPNSHINVTSYNRIVLLTGEATTPDVREDIERIARGVDNVRIVHNEIRVGQPTTLMLRSNDSVLTSKVKARFVEANKFRANHVKVVTENSVVYLMGLVKRQEAQNASEIARTSGGVHRVVRLFEYTD